MAQYIGKIMMEQKGWWFCKHDGAWAVRFLHQEKAYLCDPREAIIDLDSKER